MTLTPSTLRFDKKCGSSHIPDNRKCSKPVQSARSTAAKERSERNQRIVNAIGIGLGVGATVLTAAYLKRLYDLGNIPSGALNNNNNDLVVRNLNRQATQGNVTAQINNAHYRMGTPGPARPTSKPAPYIPKTTEERNVHAAWTTLTPRNVTGGLPDNGKASAAWTAPSVPVASRRSRLPDYERRVQQMWRRSRSS